jgi:L-fuconate dehydratase
MAVERVAARLVGLDVETLFSDMGKAWDHLVADAQLRWSVLVLKVHMPGFQD